MVLYRPRLFVSKCRVISFQESQPVCRLISYEGAGLAAVSALLSSEGPLPMSWPYILGLMQQCCGRQDVRPALPTAAAFYATAGICTAAIPGPRTAVENSVRCATLDSNILQCRLATASDVVMYVEEQTAVHVRSHHAMAVQ